MDRNRTRTGQSAVTGGVNESAPASSNIDEAPATTDIGADAAAAMAAKVAAGAPVPEGQATAADAGEVEHTAESVAELAGAGQAIPGGWAFDPRRGFFQYAAMEKSSTAPMTVRHADDTE